MSTHEELLEEIKNEARNIKDSFIERDKAQRKNWIDSDFALVKEILNPKIRGEAMVALALKLIGKSGYSMDSDSKHKKTQTAKINNKLIQIKTSSLWQGGFYKFQQIRPTDNFDLLFCFGVSPRDAHCWIIERSLIITDCSLLMEDLEGLKYQHANEKVTGWLQIAHLKNIGWLNPSDGKLDKALEVLNSVLCR